MWGYEGEEQTVIVVDDEPAHRDFLQDTLQPLGFRVVQAPDGVTCLDMLRYAQPLIFLLDVSMPGMDGWTLAGAIRERIPQACIIMVSANAHQQMPPDAEQPPHNAYLVKPIQIQSLLDALARHAGIEWLSTPTAEPSRPALLPLDMERKVPASRRQHAVSAGPAPQSPAGLTPGLREELRQLARIGYASALKKRLQSLEKEQQVDPEILAHLSQMVRSFQFTQLAEWLDEVPDDGQ